MKRDRHPDGGGRLSRLGGCAVITVSDTRRGAADRSGNRIASLLLRNGVAVLERIWVRDEVRQIRRALRTALSRPRVEAIFLTGGTGLAERDRTPEAVRPLLDRELPGFGELFRQLSYRQVGSAAWLSRAGAGVSRRKLIVWLPGSTRAVELGITKLVVPELGHALGLLAHKETGD